MAKPSMGLCTAPLALRSISSAKMFSQPTVMSYSRIRSLTASWSSPVSASTR